MVFTEISALVQTKWKLLRSAFNAEGHERRVQQRQEKMHAKQQRKAMRRAAREARRAARETRRAQRKQRHTLLSPTAVGEPTDDEERPTTSSSPRGKQPEVLTVSGGLVWARTADELTNVAGANESASFYKSKPSERRRDASRPLKEASPECFDAKPAVAGVNALTVEKAMGAVPQLSMELAFEIEAQLEQKQREFYDSLGGYSTVDEEDDELLPAILGGGRRTCDVKLRPIWTVVNIKKAAALTQESEKILLEATEQEDATDARTNGSSAVCPSSASKPRPKSLSYSSELVETEPEDEEVDLRDSAAVDGYHTFDDEEESQGRFITDLEPNGLFAPRSDNSSTECSGEASIEALKIKVYSDWCEVGQYVKVGNEGKEEVAVKIFIEIDPNEEELPEAYTVLKELETKEPLGMHDVSDEDVLEAAQPLEAKDKLSEVESVGTEPEEGLEDSEGLEVVKEMELGLKTASNDVEIVEQEVVIEEDESLCPADDNMCSQQASVPDSPYLSLLQSCNLTPGIYSPGTVDEYDCSIYKSLRAREHRYHVTEDIFAKQQSVRPRMRAVLVDWLVEVHQRFELEAQTLYLTVNYVDRYLAQASVSAQRFQLVGVAALLIASKFEEIYPCDMDDLLYICERSYSKTDLVDCERDLLNVFKFNLAVPSVSSFLGFYLEHFEEEDKLIGQLAKYFAECSLLDFTFGATYEPSIVACACLLAAYCYVENQAPSLVWNYRLLELTGYAVEAIVPCTQDLRSILLQPTELTAVATKYSVNEFGEVAHLLLDDLEVLLC